MNRRILAAVALLSPLWLAAPLRAENPQHLRKLLETKQCPGCDLSGAFVKQVNLRGTPNKLEGGGASENASKPPEAVWAQSLQEGGRVRPGGAIFEPPDNGQTSGTVGGGTRGGSCRPNGKSVIPLTPTNSPVLTVSDYPTFFAYIPESTAQTARFVLREQGEDDAVYDTTFNVPTRPGIVSVALPHAALPPLKVGKIYEWFLALACDAEGNGGDQIAQGWIERIEPSPTLVNKLKKASPRQRPRVYGHAGIWQETLTTLAQLRRSHPYDSAIAADWENLLKSVGLEEVAREPIVMEQRTRNRQQTQ